MLKNGEKYRVELSQFRDDLLADIHIKVRDGRPAADVTLFEGDRCGGQYGVIVQSTPEIETALRGLLAPHGIAGADVEIFTDRDAWPGTLPGLPRPETVQPPRFRNRPPVL